jgi:hypothetical protein
LVFAIVNTALYQLGKIQTGAREKTVGDHTAELLFLRETKKGAETGMWLWGGMGSSAAAIVVR